MPLTDDLGENALTFIIVSLDEVDVSRLIGYSSIIDYVPSGAFLFRQAHFTAGGPIALLQPSKSVKTVWGTSLASI
jgi:hypothetical protein